MKRLIFCLVLLLSFEVRAQDIATWDWSQVVLRDGNGQLMFRYTEPEGEGVAYVIYQSFEQDFVNKFVVIHLRQHNVCRMGTRTIVEGESRILFNTLPCRSFEAVDAMYWQVVASQETRPLEELPREQE